VFNKDNIVPRLWYIFTQLDWSVWLNSQTFRSIMLKTPGLAPYFTQRED
jgi:hypothetical protein